VEDNGIGFTAEKLARLQAELADESGDIKLESGFGIGNVNKRIRLYYGKQYGLSITSEDQAGTCVTIVIPARKDEPVESTSVGIAGSQLDYPAA
jgi:two-component system, sensor histidine kinase YesM